MRPATRPATRAGIVHRLDKDTSGVIIVAKDLEAQVYLAEQFKERLVRKEYLAITLGIPAPPVGRIADSLGRDRRDRKRFAAVTEGGRAAVTDYRVLSSWGPATNSGAANDGGYALVSLRPRTGRTHQLRVHMAGLGTPILGDPIYGRKDRRFPEASLMLHAYRLKIALPGGDGASLFMAPLPRRFKDILGALSAAFGAGSPLAPRGREPKNVPR
jgi:23S rRNA pseudouridine1911/1915/1917 synthase